MRLTEARLSVESKLLPWRTFAVMASVRVHTQIRASSILDSALIEV